ncbi:MAG TPA: NAD(P)H-dependent oxidoreductase subunit E, partial [Jatrophihabitans sp.]|nr:NAD(P)H-dependent oxidoreductase subunit E [Jatrophihabitans sp.]
MSSTSEPRLQASAAGVDTGGVQTSTGQVPRDELRRAPNGRLTLLDIERPGNPSVFGEQVRLAALEIVERYPVGQSRSALLPMLHLVQSEQGYVSADGIAFCADVLELTKAQVSAVATFYTMYKRQPTGEYLVSVCTNTLCGM